MEAPSFSVDTQLFRELGELLVGRDSTALIELVKNSYDADAEHTVVEASGLSSPSEGWISIMDDGVGMTEAEFRDGFLRIAGRMKDTALRRSLIHRRRFTGAKGIGRLAAHKLARVLQVDSVPHLAKLDGEPPYRLLARIDWDAVERHATLEEASKAIEFRREPAPNAPNGTTVRLSRLRRAWTPAQRQSFHVEISTFQPPSSLAAPLPTWVLDQPLLFSAPRIREADDSPMHLELLGEFDAGDDPWDLMLGGATWVLEMETDQARARFHVAPTVRARAEGVAAEARRFETSVTGAGVPEFQARVLIREGAPERAVRSQIRRASGVRVFYEGFRVLPYGEPGNDWLELQREYALRSRRLALEGYEGEALNEGLNRPANDQLHGGVFLTEAGARGLQVLVNREGFVPDRAWHELVKTLKTGVDLSTRVRATASAPRREERRSGRQHVDKAPVADRNPTVTLRESLATATDSATHARDALARGDIDFATARLSELQEALVRTTAAGEDLISAAGMQRILASLGTQMAEFVHELNEIVGSANALDELVQQVRSGGEPSRRDLREVADAVGDLRRTLERQAVLLIDVVSPDARRRRARQKLSERFEAARRFVTDAALREGVTIANDIPPDLRSPPMFPAETTTLFTNLLTNAVKFAGEQGHVRGTGFDNGATRVVVENTGVRVIPAEGERWFRPFESTTAGIDSTLGQGMGLGLTITREMLDPYGATVDFVEPSKGFATAVEVRFP